MDAGASAAGIGVCTPLVPLEPFVPLLTGAGCDFCLGRFSNSRRRSRLFLFACSRSFRREYPSDFGGDFWLGALVGFEAAFVDVLGIPAGLDWLPSPRRFPSSRWAGKKAAQYQDAVFVGQGFLCGDSIRPPCGRPGARKRASICLEASPIICRSKTRQQSCAIVIACSGRRSSSSAGNGCLFRCGERREKGCMTDPG